MVHGRLGHELTLPVVGARDWSADAKLAGHRMHPGRRRKVRGRVLITWRRRHLLQGCRGFAPPVRQRQVPTACRQRHCNIRRNLQHRGMRTSRSTVEPHEAGCVGGTCCITAALAVYGNVTHNTAGEEGSQFEHCQMATTEVHTWNYVCVTVPLRAALLPKQVLRKR